MYLPSSPWRSPRVRGGFNGRQEVATRAREVVGHWKRWRHATIWSGRCRVVKCGLERWRLLVEGQGFYEEREDQAMDGEVFWEGACGAARAVSMLAAPCWQG
jgi:hypothetical protein